MTPTEKLSDLKRRIDEADAHWNDPISKAGTSQVGQEAFNTLQNAARILSRVIENLEYNGMVENVNLRGVAAEQQEGEMRGHNALRAEIIRIITEDLT